MTPRPRWFPRQGRSTPFRSAFATLLALFLGQSPAQGQIALPNVNDCFQLEFGTNLVRVTAGTDPEFSSYDMGPSGWAVPGGTGTFEVSLDNRAVVGSVSTSIGYYGSIPNLGWPLSLTTTERTQGFQVEWTAEGDRLHVHLFSTTGAVIEPGFGPIFRVTYQVSSNTDPRYYSPDLPDVLQWLTFGFLRPDGSRDGFGTSSVVLDPLGQTIPWCGTILLITGIGGDIRVIDPAAAFHTHPLVSGMAPDGGTKADVNTNITVFFSKEIHPATVNGSSVTLFHNLVTVPATWNVSGRTVTLNPDAPLSHGTRYYVRVTEAVQDLDGNSVTNYGTAGGFTTAAPTNVEEPAPSAPSVVAARPNPFGVETSMSYSLATATHTSLRVYSASGRLIRTLVDSDMPAGVHRARWDGRDTDGMLVSSGVYFLRFAAAGVTKTQRLMLIR